MSKTLPASVQQALGNVDSEAEAVLLSRFRWLGLPKWETQAQIVPGRRYRFDAVFEDYKVAVDLQGGQYVRGKHNRPAGYEIDCIKSALAQIAGYLVIACTPAQVQSGVAGMLVMRALESRGWVNTHVPGVRGQ